MGTTLGQRSVCVCLCVYVCVQRFLHTYIHTNTNTHTHTHIGGYNAGPDVECLQRLLQDEAMRKHVDWFDSENGWTALMVAATVTGIYNRSPVTGVYNGSPVIGIHNNSSNCSHARRL